MEVKVPRTCGPSQSAGKSYLGADLKYNESVPFNAAPGGASIFLQQKSNLKLCQVAFDDKKKNRSASTALGSVSSPFTFLGIPR